MKTLLLLLASLGIAAAQCPIDTTKFAMVGPLPGRFKVNYTNATTDKTVIGVKWRLVWMDAVYDPHLVVQPMTTDAKLRPGAKKDILFDPPLEVSDKGWFIAPIKIAFEDGSTWEPTDKSCYGATADIRGKLKEAPELLFR